MGASVAGGLRSRPGPQVRPTAARQKGKVYRLSIEHFPAQLQLKGLQMKDNVDDPDLPAYYDASRQALPRTCAAPMAQT